MCASPGTPLWTSGVFSARHAPPQPKVWRRAAVVHVKRLIMVRGGGKRGTNTYRSGTGTLVVLNFNLKFSRAPSKLKKRLQNFQLEVLTPVRRGHLDHIYTTPA